GSKPIITVYGGLLFLKFDLFEVREFLDLLLQRTDSDQIRFPSILVFTLCLVELFFLLPGVNPQSPKATCPIGFYTKPLVIVFFLLLIPKSFLFADLLPQLLDGVF